VEAHRPNRTGWRAARSSAPVPRATHEMSLRLLKLIIILV